MLVFHRNLLVKERLQPVFSSVKVYFDPHNLQGSPKIVVFRGICCFRRFRDDTNVYLHRNTPVGTDKMNSGRSHAFIMQLLHSSCLIMKRSIVIFLANGMYHPTHLL